MLMFCVNVFPQEISNKIKNKMIDFMMEDSQYSDDDIPRLMRDVNNNIGVVFWIREIQHNCDMNLKVYNFGSSSNRSKYYVILLRDNEEYVILGKDLKDDMERNLLFNFIRYYDDKKIICFYETVFPKIVEKVYKSNDSIYIFKIDILRE